MDKLAVWLIAVCVSILLYWLLVEEFKLSVWWAVIFGVCLLLVGALSGKRGN